MRQNSFAIAVFIAMLPLGAAAQPLVQSQEGIALENQILQLQNQMQQLQASSSLGGSALASNLQSAPPPPSNTDTSGTAPSSDIVGNLLNQVSQLQAQMQQLSGRVDTLQNEVDTQHAATEKEIGDLNFKVNGGTPPLGGAPSQGAPQNLASGTGTQGSTATHSPLTEKPAAASSPKSAIAVAQAAFARHDYAVAETNARSVLGTSKSSPDGYKAQFILAQSLYGEGKPQEAAIAYDDAYNRNRSGSYAPGSLLGLANSLTDIQQQSAACDTLSSLNSQFPTPPAGMSSRIQAAEKRAKCN